MIVLYQGGEGVSRTCTECSSGHYQSLAGSFCPPPTMKHACTLLYYVLLLLHVLLLCTIIIITIIIIINIIKIGRQWKAEREWYTPYQSEDPSLTIPTFRQKEDKGKIVQDYGRNRAA